MPRVSVREPEMSDITIEDVKRLVVGPDETLVFMVPENTSEEQFHKISDVLREHFPPGSRVLVLSTSIDVQVITFDDPASPT